MKSSLQLSILCIIFFTFSINVFSQQNKIGNWIAYMGNQKINNKWNYHNEIQYRNYNLLGDINQLLIRTGFGYAVTKNSNLLLGYVFLESHPIDIISGNSYKITENRIFQQYINRSRVKDFYLTNRFRFEERFFSADFKTRVRYFVSLNKCLNKKDIVSHSFYMSSYNEIFLNTNGKLFDRNRFFLGGGYSINNDLRIESGFMIQFFPNSNQKQLIITFINNTPLSKLF